ncbi:MAG: transketolase-like TK C-terminal-containing protein [Acidimicrobiales bacterium]
MARDAVHRHPSRPGRRNVTAGPDQRSGPAARLDTLASIERRVLWLSTAVVDRANHGRPNPGGVKVGGHQASSASMVSIMIALWFEKLTADDRVSVKPHASPVLHAINYLLGELDESYLGTLREFGGLQSYPSRSKDPDPVDFSTGSVGIGATAPIWAAIARRYVGTHFDAPGAGRQYSLVGDAELDEGACWEAILDPAVADLGEVVWVVDVNRQSLDRVVPYQVGARMERLFTAAGWQVLVVKYGRILDHLFARPGGDALRERIDAMGNTEYQRLLRCEPAELRHRLPGAGRVRPPIERLVSDLDDDHLRAAVRNLGGHDLEALAAAFEAIDDSRPTAVLAYTLKGHALPSEGHPQNHSSLLTPEEMVHLAGVLGVDPNRPWERFPDGSREAEMCAEAAARLRHPAPAPSTPPEVPADLGHVPGGSGSTQQALGRVLLDIARLAPATADRIVTVSPDVSSSTNLGGWINRVGVWSVRERVDWFADDSQTLLHWREHPGGQHIELGIAETNLVGLLGELGATWSRLGQPLLPIGALYDPFVGRALEPWSFGIYAGGQSVLVGTPSGVSLAPEGGAHQSIVTPSIGVEQPGCMSYEPAFVVELEWCLLACLAQLGRPDGTSSYLRLSTRAFDQALAQVPEDAAGRERRRLDVVAGGYALRSHPDPALTLVAMGAVMPQVIDAAERLGELGAGADVVCVTSADLLFRALRARRGLDPAPSAVLDRLFPPERGRPMVTVLDGHPHTLAFLASVNGVPAAHLGVTHFGQSGNVEDVYRYHEIDADSIVGAGFDLLEE